MGQMTKERMKQMFADYPEARELITALNNTAEKLCNALMQDQQMVMNIYKNVTIEISNSQPAIITVLKEATGITNMLKDFIVEEVEEKDDSVFPTCETTEGFYCPDPWLNTHLPS